MTPRNLLVLETLKKMPLTVVSCREICHTTELRKVVSDLRKLGYNIQSQWCKGFDAYGNEVRFKEYFYKEENN